MIGPAEHTSPSSGYGTAISRWAGVGPYYAMFPMTFATAAIRRYTKPGDHVLDPFAGRSTTLFAAAATDRVGFGVEINPVGWVYGKAKLQTASHDEVIARYRELGALAPYYRSKAKRLPSFYQHCFCSPVLEFLLAARDHLDWRRHKTDWTTMALILVDLHGKRDAALSNQMRQTKALAPSYAMAWWQEKELTPPERDPVAWLLKKAEWRFAKGVPESGAGRVYLGDSRAVLAARALTRAPKASLLLTSPPYFAVANYFYDQWLRLWLLGGPVLPRSTGDAIKGKFAHRTAYQSLLNDVFTRSAPLLKKNAIIKVRTDAREFTRESTIAALKQAFPKKKLRTAIESQPDRSQTALFAPEAEATREVDLLIW